MDTRTVGAANIKTKSILLKEDFAGLNEPYSESDLFDGILDCEGVMNKLKEYKNMFSHCRDEDKNPSQYIQYNFVFAGAPGTGKTTVTNRMGKMFHMLGILPTDEEVETSTSQLQTGYVGQSGKKTKEMLMKARGNVLFIDETYQLMPTQGGAYMQEVVDELVKDLTSKEFKDKLEVILAGYKSEMDQMLDANQGLCSRFSEKLQYAMCREA